MNAPSIVNVYCNSSGYTLPRASNLQVTKDGRKGPKATSHDMILIYKNIDKVQNGRPQNVYLKSVWLK